MTAKLTAPQRRVLRNIARILDDHAVRRASMIQFTGPKAKPNGLRDDETYLDLHRGGPASTPAAVVARLAACGMIEFRTRRELEGMAYAPGSDRGRRVYRRKYIVRLTDAGKAELAREPGQ